MLIEYMTEVLIVSFIPNLWNSHRATESARSLWGLTCRLQSSLKNTKKHVWLTKREKFHTALVFKQMQDVCVWCAAATHREQLEEGVLENLPLLVLIGNHGNVDFAEILREEEDQTHRAVRKKKKAHKKKKSRDATKHFGQTLHRPVILSLFWPCGWIYIFFTSSHISICTPAACRPHLSSSGGLFGMCVYNYITISHKISSQLVRLRFFLLLFLSIWLNCFYNSKRFDRPGRDWIPRFPLCRALQPRKLMTRDLSASHDHRQDCGQRETGGVVSPTTQTYWVSFCVNFCSIRTKNWRQDAKKTCKENKVTLPPPILRVWPISYHNIVLFFLSFVFFFFFS